MWRVRCDQVYFNVGLCSFGVCFACSLLVSLVCYGIFELGCVSFLAFRGFEWSPAFVKSFY